MIVCRLGLIVLLRGPLVSFNVQSKYVYLKDITYSTIQAKESIPLMSIKQDVSANVRHYLQDVFDLWKCMHLYCIESAKF